jgi:adenylate cyclase
MNLRILTIGLSLTILFSLAFLLSHFGERGEIENKYLNTTLYGPLQSFKGWVTDLKFKIRGTEKSKNKIIIVSIDEHSTEILGRWPWHRDISAQITDQTINLGARNLGIDIIYSKRDPRVPTTLREGLKEKSLEPMADAVETDPLFQKAIQEHAEQVVLGILSERSCRPYYDNPYACPSIDPLYTAALENGFERFTIKNLIKPPSFDFKKTPLYISQFPVMNIPEFQNSAKHLGFFDANLDPDGVIRSSILFKIANEKALPSFALEMARLARGKTEELQLTLNDRHQAESLKFSTFGQEIPITPMGLLEINYRGGEGIFPKVSAADVLDGKDNIAITIANIKSGLPFPCESCKNTSKGNKKEMALLASKKELFKDAIVFFGLGLPTEDVKATPFGAQVNGVLNHANIVDNLLAGDALVPSCTGYHWIIILLIMVLGGAGLCLLIGRFSSTPAVLSSLGALVAVAVTDGMLFKNHINWNSGFIYLEFVTLSIFILLQKYVVEEARGRFFKNAFSRFVSPQVVDEIIRDPGRLNLSGDAQELTVLFSDIRGFMPFSQRLGAEKLHQFLNEYHNIMTKIVIETGTLDKYIGDAIMAFWGAPLSQKNHASNACQAAIRMIQELEKKSEQFKKKYGETVSIGIGINTGPVIVGNMGSEQIFSYTAIGDEVNLASRVERLTRYYGVNILTTRATLDTIKYSGATMPPFRILDIVKVKGAQFPIEVAQILERPYPDIGLKLFAESRKLYQERQWPRALERFKAAQECFQASLGVGDVPTQLYLERCEKFKLYGPPSDWSGHWEMDSK